MSTSNNNIRVVINIPKEEYKAILNRRSNYPIYNLLNYVLNGTPLKGGHWIEKEVLNIKDTTITELQYARCSHCKKYHTTPYSYFFYDYKYCPYCGTELEGE